MTITKRTNDGNTVYIAVANIFERNLPKDAGFKWDYRLWTWWTRNMKRAALLAEYADDTCKAELSAIPVRAHTWNRPTKPPRDPAKKRRDHRLVVIPSGSVIAIGIHNMIAEDGTDIHSSKVAGLYKLHAVLPSEADIELFLLTEATLVAQCPATDWQTAVTALTAEDQQEDVI